MDDVRSPFGEDFPEELIALVKPELEPVERLLWASRPGPRAPKNGTGNFSVAVSVWAVGMVILSLACLFGSKAASDRLAGLSALLLTIAVVSGVVSFLIVLGWLSSVFSDSTDRQGRSFQVYALTDRRVIFKSTDPKTLATKIQSFHRGTIKEQDLHRIEYPDGAGDVVFRPAYGVTSGFLDVADVRRLEGLIRRFLIASDPGSTP